MMFSDIGLHLYMPSCFTCRFASGKGSWRCCRKLICCTRHSCLICALWLLQKLTPNVATYIAHTMYKWHVFTSLQKLVLSHVRREQRAANTSCSGTFQARPDRQCRQFLPKFHNQYIERTIQSPGNVVGCLYLQWYLRNTLR